MAWSVHAVGTIAGVNIGSVAELYVLAKKDPVFLADMLTCVKNESEKVKRGKTNKRPIQKLGPGSHIST